MLPDPDNIETVAMATAPPSTPAPQRFAPGTLLASRYRIVSRLGKIPAEEVITGPGRTALEDHYGPFDDEILTMTLNRGWASPSGSIPHS